MVGRFTHGRCAGGSGPGGLAPAVAIPWPPAKAIVSDGSVGPILPFGGDRWTGTGPDNVSWLDILPNPTSSPPLSSSRICLWHFRTFSCGICRFWPFLQNFFVKIKQKHNSHNYLIFGTCISKKILYLSLGSLEMKGQLPPKNG